MLTSAWLAFRMFESPTWHQLRMLALAVPIQCLFYRMYSLPMAKGLFH